MIAFVRGNVFKINEHSVVLDVGDIGYEVFVPDHLLYMVEDRESLMLYTYQHIKEDATQLYGFAREGELDLFRRLITVSGVGPKLALVALSSKSPRELISAIMQDRPDILSEVPGIGAKTAKRMILELKESIESYLADTGEIVPQVPAETGEGGEAPAEAAEEALEGLLALGYAKREVERCLRTVVKQQPELSAGEILSRTLKELGNQRSY